MRKNYAGLIHRTDDGKLHSRSGEAHTSCVTGRGGGNHVGQQKPHGKKTQKRHTIKKRKKTTEWKNTDTAVRRAPRPKTQAQKTTRPPIRAKRTITPARRTNSLVANVSYTSSQAGMKSMPSSLSLSQARRAAGTEPYTTVAVGAKTPPHQGGGWAPYSQSQLKRRCTYAATYRLGRCGGGGNIGGQKLTLWRGQSPTERRLRHASFPFPLLLHSRW